MRAHDKSGPFTLGRKLVGLAAKGIDRAVVSAVHLRSARRETTHGGLTAEKKLTWLLKAADDYAPALAGPHDAFFVRPDAVTVTTERVARLRGRLADDAAGTFDLAWPSALPAWLPEMRDPLRARRENLSGRARVFRGGLGRPVVVCLHGYLGGNYAIEELKFPTEFFFQNGIDVALPVLPHHAGRGARGKGPPPFPSVDPALTNEGFRQAIYDLRVLIAHLRAEGAPWVGAIGTSLGGHTVTLLATLEDDLAFVVPVVPLASVADFARDHGELGHGAESERLFDAFERANAVVSPYSRPSRVSNLRTFVIGAEGDAITGVAHAERIARHLDAKVAVTPGGHLLQLWRGALTRGLAPILAELPHR